jgi:hypothetical protein
MLGRYPQELNSLPLSDQRTVGDMVSCGSDGFPKSQEVAPRNRQQTGPTIKHDSVGHSMQAHNVLNVQLCIFLHFVAGMPRNEVGRLGKVINNHPNGIILAGSER